MWRSFNLETLIPVQHQPLTIVYSIRSPTLTSDKANIVHVLDSESVIRAVILGVEWRISDAGTYAETPHCKRDLWNAKITAYLLTMHMLRVYGSPGTVHVQPLVRQLADLLRSKVSTEPPFLRA